jgi:hypothetical protein
MVTKYVLKTRSAHSKRPGVIDPKPGQMVAGVSKHYMQYRIITENSGQLFLRMCDKLDTELFR